MEMLGRSRHHTQIEQSSISEITNIVMETMCFDPPKDIVPEEYRTSRAVAVNMVTDYFKEQGIADSVIRVAITDATDRYNKVR